MSEPFDPLQAAVSDRYTVERKLGAGGKATVYLAHDVRHNRKVGTKHIPIALPGIPRLATLPVGC